MSSNTYNKKNYVFLYRGLIIVRDALLEFIVNSLKSDIGKEWWKIGVEPAFRSEDIEKLKAQFQKRFSHSDGPERPGTEIHEILDLNYFGNVIEYNWKKIFSKKLNNDRTLLTYIKEIVAFRNPVAHTETGDLRDDDAFRGLDTGDRLLRLISKNASDELIKIKNEMRSEWIYDEIGLGISVPEKVGINLEQGFERLAEAIAKKRNVAEDTTLLKNLRQSLFAGISALREKAGSQDAAIANQIVFNSLQQLSQKYLGTDFSSACTTYTILPKFTPAEVSKKTLAIDLEIEQLEKEIKNLEADLEFQKDIGLEKTQFILRRIALKKKLLNVRRKDLEKLQVRIVAPVFFSVSRFTDQAIQEETPFVVHVEIKNLGSKKTTVAYKDGVSTNLRITSGDASYVGEIGPGMTQSISYTCEGVNSGQHFLYTERLDYEEKLGEWDLVPDTIILILPGTGPHLAAQRLYRFAEAGLIDVLVRLENFGDKTAKRVGFDNELIVKNKGKRKLSFHGDIKPKERALAKCPIEAIDISEIGFPKATQIYYCDNNENEYSLDVTDDFSLLEYDFPPIVDLVGRDSELEQVEKIFKLVSGDSAQGQVYFDGHSFLVEGVAGVGKSRFIHETKRIAAEKYNFLVYVEDVSNRSSVKRILRSILNLDSKFATKDEVREKIREIRTGALFRQQGVLERFLASDNERIEELDAQDLVTDILILIRYMCQKHRIYLIFENTHEFSEGLELKIFQKLLKYVVETPDLPIVIGVTHRPIEDLRVDFIGKDLKVSRFEKIVMKQLDQEQTNHLIDNFIPYPTLSPELRGFVYDKSQGNPFYIRELLRQLASPERGYIKRVGDNWYPAPNFQTSDFTSQLSTLLYQRVKEDSGEFFAALQVLSVAGLDLPYRLLVPLFGSNTLFPISEGDLINVLENLERKGFLQKTSTASSSLEYRFTHQLIRDTIYEDIRNSIHHTRIREQLVNIIIPNEFQGMEIFSDREEYYRQIARHLLYAGRDDQYGKREYLLRAAHIEESKQNFPRSLEFYRVFISCSSGRDNKLEQAEALIGVSVILKLQGNWAQAIDHLRAAFSVLPSKVEKHQNTRLTRTKSRILAEQGFLFIQTQEYEKANDYLSRARLSYEGPFRSLQHYFIPKDKDFLEDLIEIYLGLAEVWHRKSNILPSFVASLRNPIFTFRNQETETYFDRAEVIAKRYLEHFSSNEQLIKVLVRQGEVYSQRDQEKALGKLLKAIDTTKEKIKSNASNQYAIERAYSFLAEIFRERDDVDKAKQYYLEARKIQDDLQDVYGLAISNGGIGDLYVEQELYPESEYYLLDAFKYQQLVGDSERLWRTCFSLVRVYSFLNYPEKAKYYWAHARPLILDRLQAIKPEKLEAIFGTLFALARLYFKENKWEDSLSLCLDLQILAKDGERLSDVNEMMGKIYHKMKDPSQAIRVLYEGLEMTSDPLKRADLHSLLGDICASTKDSAMKSNIEENYEECVKILVENKFEREALGIYDRLLRYISTEQETQRLSLLLHNLIELTSKNNKSFNSKFLEKAEKLFNQHKLYKEAGDAFVHIAYKTIQIRGKSTLFGMGWIAENDGEEIALIHKAEEYYTKCRGADQRIGGFYKLISIYFRLNLWDEIARCYKLILDACAKLNEPEILKETLREINMLENRFHANVLEEVLRKVNAALETFKVGSGGFTDEIKHSLQLGTAKLLYGISEKVIAEDRKAASLQTALERYDEIIDKSKNLDLVGTCCNDSALILQSLGRTQEAEKRLIRSIEIAEGAENKFSEACCRGNYAIFLQSANRSQESISEYEKSINVLVNVNHLWDERRRHIDVTPMTPDQIARSRFEKNWCASISENYGAFIYLVENNKAIKLLNLAKAIYSEIDDKEGVARIEGKLQRGGQISSFLPIRKNLADTYFSVSDLETKYLRCAVCGNLFPQENRKCSNCGSKTCFNCGQVVPAESEYCEFCDHWVG